MPFDGLVIQTVRLVKRIDVRSERAPEETEAERELRIYGDPNHKFSRGGRHIKRGH